MPRRLSWVPRLDDRPGPKYLRIADALAEDVYSGRLQIGDRLPPHRELAWELKVTVGTVSRAYAEAERRGLLVGEVGRGSYVRAGARSQSTLAMPDLATPSKIELAVNRPPAHLAAPHFARALSELSADPDLEKLLNYQAHTGPWEHRLAGASFLARRGVEVPADRVLVTSGAQHALAAAFTAFCDPGDPILVESLTWSGTRALASLMRMDLRPVAMDGDGLLPDALDMAIRATGAKVLYTVPLIHNPTCAVLPLERREAIVEVARAHNLLIIEDDIYGMLPPDPPPAVAALAPERTLYVTATSKTMAPALRIGYVAVPDDRLGRFAAAARANNWMAPPLMGEVAARWLADGTADALTEDIRKEARRRHAIAARILDGFDYAATPESFHVWLQLPEPWRAEDLVRAAGDQGVSLVSTELFVPGRGETPHAVRLSLTGTRNVEDLETGLGLLRSVLAGEPEPRLAVA